MWMRFFNLIRNTILIALFVSLFPANCAIKKDAAPGGDWSGSKNIDYREAGDTGHSIGYGEWERTYRLHIPPGTDKSIAIPLVIVLHGATGNARTMYEWDAVNMNVKADERKFIAVYPDGTGNTEAQVFFWNAAHCCGFAYLRDVDDVGFIRLLIETLTVELNLDPERIFVTGFSNGGMLAHRLGAELPDLIAAIAPLAATIGGRSTADADLAMIPQPIAPIPVIMFHGLEDQEVPYEGGHIVARQGREDISAAFSAAFWAFHNHCYNDPVTTTSPFGGYFKTVYTPDAGSNGAEVVLYSILNLAHKWPGKVGNTTATDIILDFFFRQRQ
jgi:polyhydroxybutyrate depolymerase